MRTSEQIATVMIACYLLACLSTPGQMSITPIESLSIPYKAEAREGTPQISGVCDLANVKVVIRHESNMTIENGVARSSNPRTFADWNLSSAKGTYTLSAKTQKGQQEATGEIIDIGVFLLEKEGQESVRVVVPVLVAQGTFFCTHPDYIKEPIMSPNGVVNGTFPYPAGSIFTNAHPSVVSPRVITCSGIGFFALDGDSSSGELHAFDTSAMFAPGRKWQLTAPVSFGFRERDGSAERVLAPGTYHIVKEGVPKSVPQATSEE